MKDYKYCNTGNSPILENPFKRIIKTSDSFRRWKRTEEKFLNFLDLIILSKFRSTIA